MYENGLHNSHHFFYCEKNNKYKNGLGNAHPTHNAHPALLRSVLPSLNMLP
jgi:hypothetical protein